MTKNKTISKWTVALFTCILFMLASLMGMGIIYASAQEEQPTAVSVELTSYTYAMQKESDFQFAAKVLYDDDTTGTTVKWTSSNEDVIIIDEADGTAVSVELGTATITATAAEGIYASIDVTVVDTIQDVTFTPATLSLTIDGNRANLNNIYYLGEDWSKVTLPTEITDFITTKEVKVYTYSEAGEGQQDKWHWDATDKLLPVPWVENKESV